MKGSNQKNVTLSLPEDLLRRFRVYAASHDRSMNELMTRAIQRMLVEGDTWEESQRRFIDGIRNADDLGTNGVLTWTRDEIHER